MKKLTLFLEIYLSSFQSKAFFMPFSLQKNRKWSHKTQRILDFILCLKMWPQALRMIWAIKLIKQGLIYFFFLFTICQFLSIFFFANVNEWLIYIKILVLLENWRNDSHDSWLFFSLAQTNEWYMRLKISKLQKS